MLVGNKVVIREDLELGKVSELGYFVDNNVFNAKGYVVTVKEIFDNGSFIVDELGNDGYSVFLVQDWVFPANSDARLRCAICDTDHLVDELEYKSGVGYVCKSCLENASLCSKCGKVMSTTKETIDGKVFCDDCIDKISKIHSWHDYSTSWVSRTIGSHDNSLLIGVELEIDDGLDNRTTTKEIAKIMGDACIYAYDGSLNTGFEIISHPYSFNFWQDKVDYVKNMMDICTSKGYTSHEAGTCGLHFHVNREQLKTSSRSHDQVVDNILLIMETFKDELCSFGRRHSTQYAQFLQDCIDGRTINLKYVKEHKQGKSRYMALNLQNRNTIEFRFFKGTLKFETLMASVELVNNLCNIAMHEEIDGLTWEDIINYNIDKNNYIVAYNSLRRIVSDRKVQVLSFFELHKDEFTIDRFKNGEFTINIDYECNSEQRTFLLGVLYALGLKDEDGKVLRDGDIRNVRLKVRNNGTLTTLGTTNMVNGKELIQFWMKI